MKYRTIQDGDIKIKTKFAWFPVSLCHDSQTVWLERFKIVTIKKYRPYDTIAPLFSPKPYLEKGDYWDFIGHYSYNTTNEKIIQHIENEPCYSRLYNPKHNIVIT